MQIPVSVQDSSCHRLRCTYLKKLRNPSLKWVASVFWWKYMKFYLKMPLAGQEPFLQKIGVFGLCLNLFLVFHHAYLKKTLNFFFQPSINLQIFYVRTEETSEESSFYISVYFHWTSVNPVFLELYVPRQIGNVPKNLVQVNCYGSSHIFSWT